LGGIETALYHAQYDDVLMVACDMPWLNVDLLQYMIDLRGETEKPVDIIVPRWQKFPEPLHALYNKRCLPEIAANLEAKRLKITGFYGRMRVRYVEREEIVRFDAHGRSFANINTPDELEAIRSNKKNR
jgi:molybdopterin-guanine dinucleotide biosynthesis protein A